MTTWVLFLLMFAAVLLADLLMTLATMLGKTIAKRWRARRPQYDPGAHWMEVQINPHPAPDARYVGRRWRPWARATCEDAGEHPAGFVCLSCGAVTRTPVHTTDEVTCAKVRACVERAAAGVFISDALAGGAGFSCGSCGADGWDGAPGVQRVATPVGEDDAWGRRGR